MTTLLPSRAQRATVVGMGQQRVSNIPDDQPSEGESVWALSADAFREWRAGNRGAVQQLVALMNPVLWHVVRAYRLDEHAAKDVVQETWVSVCAVGRNDK